MRVAWYLAQLKPNALRIAEQNLRRQGFEVFMPRLQETVRKARFETRLAPLFPGYVFVGTPADNDNASFIRSTRGITQLVKSGDRVAPLPANIIEELRRRCDANGLYIPEPELASGDAVEITGGAFAQYFGTVHELPSEERVWVLLDVMGRGTLTELRTQDVRRLNSQSE